MQDVKQRRAASTQVISAQPTIAQPPRAQPTIAQPPRAQPSSAQPSQPQPNLPPAYASAAHPTQILRPDRQSPRTLFTLQGQSSGQAAKDKAAKDKAAKDKAATRNAAQGTHRQASVLASPQPAARSTAKPAAKASPQSPRVAHRAAPAAASQSAPSDKSSPSIRSAPKTPSRKPGRRNPWLLVGGGLLATSLLSATAGALLAFSLSSTPLMQSRLSWDDSSIFARPGEEPIASRSLTFPELNRPVNILILGTKVLTSDVASPNQEASTLGYHALVNSLDGLSDTMLLLRFDPSNHKLSVLSIPRDTRTEVGDLGMVKINEANAEGGPALAAQSVSQLLNGVSIDRYVRINVQGIEKLIDALGGVKVHVPIDMKYQDDSQHLYINLKAGEQQLTGAKALQFLRFRYDENGDIGRIQRQQTLMRALMEQTLNPKILGRVPQVLSIIRAHLDTNLTVEELLALVNFGTKTDRGGVQMLMLPGNFSDPEQFSASYWLPDYARINTLTAQYFNVGETLADSWSEHPDLMRISIQNSLTDESPLALLQDQLAQRGYTNVAIAKPWPQPLQVTRIVAQQGDLDSARAIQRTLGLGEIRVESTGDLESDITIQVGEDWLQKEHVQGTEADHSPEHATMGHAQNPS